MRRRYQPRFSFRTRLILVIIFMILTVLSLYLYYFSSFPYRGIVAYVLYMPIGIAILILLAVEKKPSLPSN